MATDQRREQQRQAAARYRAKHPERVRAYNRRKYQETKPASLELRKAHKLRQYHGMSTADWQAMWDAQGGRCYLCGNELTAGHGTHIDHDHACCTQGYSCERCRRGLSCNNCNVAIGMAGDDAERLLRVALNLLAAQMAVRIKAGDPS
jgi:recombination endonuclease VII